MAPPSSWVKEICQDFRLVRVSHPHVWVYTHTTLRCEFICPPLLDCGQGEGEGEEEGGRGGWAGGGDAGERGEEGGEGGLHEGAAGVHGGT